MENNKDLKNLSKDLFERVEIDPSNQEKIDRPSLTYWQDARRRLVSNKGAIAGFVLLVVIVIMAFVGPLMNSYTYREQIEPLRQHNKLPPRVQGLEKIGIFDGTITKDVGQNTLDQYKEGEYELLEEYFKEDILEVPESALDRYEESQYEILSEEDGIYTIAYKQQMYKIKEFTYVVNNVEDKYFWFGTDDLARDIWTRVWKGTQISLFIGLLAAVLDMLLGVTYGSIAGYYGGKVDLYMMRILEIINGIPALVIIILLLLVMEPGILPISIAIALTGWMSMARVVRSQFLKLKSQEFVLASRTLGASNRKLIIRHLIPNIIGQIIIIITFTIPGAIFYEAFLAFIGLGLPAPNASLGVLIEEGLQFIRTIPSILFIPTVVLSLLMLSINIFANGLRDALDPKMRNN